MVHEKKKDHQCDQCEYRAGSAFNLNRHKRTAHEKKKSISNKRRRRL